MIGRNILRKHIPRLIRANKLLIFEDPKLFPKQRADGHRWEYRSTETDEYLTVDLCDDLDHNNYYGITRIWWLGMRPGYSTAIEVYMQDGIIHHPSEPAFNFERDEIISSATIRRKQRWYLYGKSASTYEEALAQLTEEQQHNLFIERLK